MTNVAAGDPKSPAPQLFIPAGWSGEGQPPLYTAAQVAELTATAQPAAPQGVAYAELPEFEELDDDLIDLACSTGALYRVDFRRAWEVMREGLRASHGQAPAGAAVVDQNPQNVSDKEACVTPVIDKTATTAQAAPAAKIPNAALADLHEGLAAKLHDGPARNLHLETAAALQAPAAGAVAVPDMDAILAAARNWGDVEPYLCRSGSGEQKHRIVFHVHERAAHFAKELLAAAPTPAAQADSQLEDAARLAKITQAIRDYHFALDNREHGGVAMARAWNAICDVLNMDWVQGAESAARKQGGKHD